MTSKRSVKNILKAARRVTEPFSVSVGGQAIDGEFGVIGFLKWQELLEAHPPRPGHEIDKGWGFSYATFWPEAVRVAMVSPVMDDEDWETFVSLLSSPDMIRLGVQVVSMNLRGEGASDAVPKELSESPEAELPNSA